MLFAFSEYFDLSLWFSKSEWAVGPVTLVIHGGAGDIVRGRLTPAEEVVYRTQLKHALIDGLKILEQGGKSAEAVVRAIQILEASPLFNAGKGSVRNSEGLLKWMLSVMDGGTRLAGAVAGVRTIKSPITAAYRVMTEYCQRKLKNDPPKILRNS